mmetsp:Transcript_20563/g.50333  ORF Transcript_20563/g.50333 Transcript_20563/m.50333 type:complete len:324 (-) Transcript_20563:540-1511(-)
MEEKDEELLRLAATAGYEDEIRSFGPHGRESILRRHKPTVALKKMLGILEGLEDLKVAEKSIDASHVRRVLQSGWIQVLGRDKKGRPVFWEQSKIPNGLFMASGTALQNQCAGYSLVWAWVFLFAMRERLSHTDGVTYIFDSRGLGILSRLSTMSIFIRLLHKVLPDPPTDSRLVVLNTETGALYFRALMKMLPNSHAQALSVVSSPDEIFAELENPCDFPDWFEPGGRPYTLSSETHGEYRLLLDRCAFATLRVYDIYRVLPTESLEDAPTGESPGDARRSRPRRSSSGRPTNVVSASGSVENSWSSGSISSCVTANGEYLI